ncbi:MAG TPA: exodeoxyribonuclease VII large subunit [Bacillota bacterium]|mgnify:CR=1 FL=1|nr:exodeoxyribonuclease VII large subunit [Bacillota bacterium]HOL09401.1 exodeoxyribonuclease VII large subunit [Bacillota bacterium]HPO97125.1 exodeoxyribonuclease VII large subunit [Bacillota bacterium]
MASKYLTVSALTLALKRLLEESVNLEDVWIKGEISNFTPHSSGHLYFTLKDANARLSCVMFRSQARSLKFKPENGQAIVVTGKISIYEKSGNYQLYVERMELDGVGNLYQAFEELKQKLNAEGLFAPERKRLLPELPQRVGIITSPTGAAVQDMIKILRRRRPNLDILIIPALVQGSEAPLSLVRALKQAAAISDLDLIIIGRGGGSIEELWAFNDERVARAIANHPQPVISAVGHETDFTIADFVADLRAPTPSAAAELAVPDQQAYCRNLDILCKRLNLSLKRRLQSERQHLVNLITKRVFAKPQLLVDQRRQNLNILRERLIGLSTQHLQIKRERFSKVVGKLDALSPLATLQRGYSIARKNDGAVISDVKQVNVAEQINVKLAVGSLACQVLNKTED